MHESLLTILLSKRRKYDQTSPKQIKTKTTIHRSINYLELNELPSTQTVTHTHRSNLPVLTYTYKQASSGFVRKL